MACCFGKKEAKKEEAAPPAPAKKEEPAPAAPATPDVKEAVNGEKYEVKEAQKEDKDKKDDKPTDEGSNEDEDEDDDDDVLSETEFLAATKVDPAKQAKMRTSVSAEAYGEWNKKEAFTPPVFEKTDEQKARLTDTLGKSFMFRALNKNEMSTVIDAMEEKRASAGERLIKHGDEGDFLFVIEAGSLECRKEIDGNDTLLKTVETGDVFGELALLYNTVRAANVDAKEDCVLWKLDRQSFTHIVVDAALKKRERYEGFLAKVPLLKDMDNYERSQLCDGLQHEKFGSGDKIITEGEEGDKFFIIEAGNATAVKSGCDPLKYGPGDYFGELALLHNAPRAATVTAESEVEALVLDRGAFKRLFSGSAKMIQTFKAQQKY